MPWRSSVMMAVGALALALAGRPAAATTPSAMRPVALDAPLNSGICGLCENARCAAPQRSFRCVRLSNAGSGEISRYVECDERGRFRAPLPPGQYFLDRADSGSAVPPARNGPKLEVRANEWTRLDGQSEADCPNSGIYGWDYVPCWGTEPPRESYQCVTVLDRSTGAVKAAGNCSVGYPVFNVPLPPGSYVVKSPHWPPQTVNIEPHQWIRLGVKEAPPCLPSP